jgi:ABC-type phosphate transport system substrate-binding protein
MLRKITYSLFGERAGRVLVGGWNWLWGKPVEEGGQVAVSVAEESLRTMQESVQRLTQAVSTEVASYQRAQQKYQEKVKEFNQNAEEYSGYPPRRKCSRDGNAPGSPNYPLVSVLYYIYSPNATVATKAFVAFATSPAGKAIAALE